MYICIYVYMYMYMYLQLVEESGRIIYIHVYYIDTGLLLSFVHVRCMYIYLHKRAQWPWYIHVHVHVDDAKWTWYEWICWDSKQRVGTYMYMCTSRFGKSPCLCYDDSGLYRPAHALPWPWSPLCWCSYACPHTILAHTSMSLLALMSPHLPCLSYVHMYM